MNLLEIRLPEGRVSGFDVAFRGDQRTKYPPPPPGYDGYRFIGAGRNRTHIIPDDDAWHDSGVFVGPHNGIIQLESLSVHGGNRCAVHMGDIALMQRFPKLALRARDVAFVADPPGTHPWSRSVWGYRSYQCDIDLEDCEFFWAEAAEHAGYADHFSRLGLRWKRVIVHGSGAEGCKIRCPVGDGLWTKGATATIDSCDISNWKQPHTWRGGAGVVVQGSGLAAILIQKTRFTAPADDQHTRAIMIDDGGGDSYSALTGKPNEGPANGAIAIRQCGISVGPGTVNYSPVIRVAPDGAGTRPVCTSLEISNSGVWGENILLQYGNIPRGKLSVSGCNTPLHREWGTAHGLDTREEARLPVGLVPFSVGLTA